MLGGNGKHCWICLCVHRHRWGGEGTGRYFKKKFYNWPLLISIASLVRLLIMYVNKIEVIFFRNFKINYLNYLFDFCFQEQLLMQELRNQQIQSAHLRSNNPAGIVDDSLSGLVSNSSHSLPTVNISGVDAFLGQQPVVPVNLHGRQNSGDSGLGNCYSVPRTPDDYLNMDNLDSSGNWINRFIVSVNSFLNLSCILNQYRHISIKV